MTVSLCLVDTPLEEARASIIAGLDDYNIQHTSVADNTALDVLVFDELADRVLGGLVGRTSLGVFFIDYFFLPAALRGRGHGTQVLAKAEAEAVRRGCSRAVLFTMTIQAPLFYEKQGYETFGRIECNPPGNARIFMKKELRSS